MPDSTAGLPPRFLRTPEAARYLGLSGRTLEKHRTYGTGPTYRKIGGRVVYALDDLKAWADLGAKTSTSDPGKGACCPPKGTRCCARMRARNVADRRVRAVIMRRKHHSERDQLELFRALPGDLAPRDAQDLMAYPFFSLAKTKRIVPIDFRAGGDRNSCRSRARQNGGGIASPGSTSGRRLPILMVARLGSS